MTITAFFEYYGHRIEAVAIKDTLVFLSEDGRPMGLQLDYNGVLLEHPDLKDNPEWKKIAIERLMAHVKSLGSEDKTIDYVVSELKPKGYKPLFKRKDGFRPIKLT